MAVHFTGAGNCSARSNRNRVGGCPLRWCFWLLLLLVACLAMPGCGGCGAGDEGEVADEEAEAEAEKEKAKQKEKPKPNFEEPKLHIQPDMPAAERVFAVKPGHWTMATSEMKANNFDYTGELHVTMSDRSGQPTISGKHLLRSLHRPPGAFAERAAEVLRLFGVSCRETCRAAA